MDTRHLLALKMVYVVLVLTSAVVFAQALCAAGNYWVDGEVGYVRLHDWEDYDGLKPQQRSEIRKLMVGHDLSYGSTQFRTRPLDLSDMAKLRELNLNLDFGRFFDPPREGTEPKLVFPQDLEVITLDFGQEDIPAALVSALAGCKKLKTLSIDGLGLTANGIKRLSQLTSVTELRVHSLRPAEDPLDQKIAALAALSMPNVRVLHFDLVELSIAGLAPHPPDKVDRPKPIDPVVIDEETAAAAAPSLPNVKVLHVRHEHYLEVWRVLLKGLALTEYSGHLDDDRIKELVELQPDLEAIDLTYSKVTDAGAAYLPKFKKLRRVVESRKMGDAGLAEICKCTGLEELRLESPPEWIDIYTQGAEPEDAQRAILQRSRYSEDALFGLRKLTKLRHLEVHSVATLTMDVLKAVMQQCTAVETLDVSGCPHVDNTLFEMAAGAPHLVNLIAMKRASNSFELEISAFVSAEALEKLAERERPLKSLLLSGVSLAPDVTARHFAALGVKSLAITGLRPNLEDLPLLMKSVEVLDLGGSTIPDVSKMSFDENSACVELRLMGCKGDVKALLSKLVKLKNLQRLDVSWTTLGVDDLELLCDSPYLRVVYTAFSGRSWEQARDDLTKLRQFARASNFDWVLR